MIKLNRNVFIIVCFCTLLISFENVSAQIYTIRNGKMYIEIEKNISPVELDSFIVQYDLSDVGIKHFLRTQTPDSIHMMGWEIAKNDKKSFAISKLMISSDDLKNYADKIVFSGSQPGFPALFPATNNGLFYGFNKFKNKPPFISKDSTVTFYLRNHSNAKKVMLAGSFNNWIPDALPMTKTDSGWIAFVNLGPGKYWYKFISDGNWIVDDDNIQRENDGLGNMNSVFYKVNHSFKVQGYNSAKRVYVAGSFNNWRPNELQLWKTGTGWELPIYLAEGTHTYKFIIDGNWKTDAANPDKLPNEFNDFNSVIHFGKPYLFKLIGFEDAKTVTVTGSFNGWRKDELFMTKTAGGWEYPYTLGPGNYEYRFIVDGKEMTDPSNPLVTAEGKKGNSFLILEPNYIFRLKGFPNAKKVFLAGDFNGFNPNSHAMKKVGEEWQFSIHLSRGKHLYKFIVDGKWIRDPNNKLWEQNEFMTGDSIIWIEK
ncbi:MAG: hypothetical protein ABIO04_03520 [Ferruginibacter sp.]